MPRSGTTLIRTILNTHPLLSCGEETRVMQKILGMRNMWRQSKLEWNLLISAGMSEDILDSAVRAFIYEILVRQSHYNTILCINDHFVLKDASYISKLFPNSKFLLLIRDARAVIHSIMSKNVTIIGFSLTDYRKNFKSWNNGIDSMVKACINAGPSNCLFVYYEQLVLHPKSTIKNIFKFLTIPWADSVLHHDKLIGEKILLFKTAYFSDQIIKLINLESLTKWFGHIPDTVKREIDILAPMLKQLGYDTQSEMPFYGEPDHSVIDNSNNVKKNTSFWNDQMRRFADSDV
ncbi:unnamed protein product [Didymodactylos carnosus]|uniref:Protein-tyrosine sulfotransferase n=1 Tax=Didymodactylos carnosus TaxID=1234261 RepID=A0A815ZW43_9BILA|nr:unnamed protein product [Didymodactylos carnosus]CAF4457573.1 unnamed protein product [Didymodactylos carnosus]